MSIARFMVEAHGGRIWIESQPGCGTIVHFTLPIFFLPQENCFV
jgi:signal transduction histidine kinase